MNWLFWIVVAIIVFFAIRGWNRGLLRILYSLISADRTDILCNAICYQLYKRKHRSLHFITGTLYAGVEKSWRIDNRRKNVGTNQ